MSANNHAAVISTGAAPLVNIVPLASATPIKDCLVKYLKDLTIERVHANLYAINAKTIKTRNITLNRYTTLYQSMFATFVCETNMYNASAASSNTSAASSNTSASREADEHKSLHNTIAEYMKKARADSARCGARMRGMSCKCYCRDCRIHYLYKKYYLSILHDICGRPMWYICNPQWPLYVPVTHCQHHNIALQLRARPIGHKETINLRACPFCLLLLVVRNHPNASICRGCGNEWIPNATFVENHIYLNEDVHHCSLCLIARNNSPVQTTRSTVTSDDNLSSAASMSSLASDDTVSDGTSNDNMDIISADNMEIYQADIRAINTILDDNMEYMYD